MPYREFGAGGYVELWRTLLGFFGIALAVVSPRNIQSDRLTTAMVEQQSITLQILGHRLDGSRY
jgi:hypothetical protein